MIVIPTRHTDFQDWAASLRQLRPDLDIQPLRPTEDNWRDYASRVIQSQVCQTNNSPRPEQFKTWQMWVDAFIRSFGTNA